jgi:excisionase family DNA binding protein
MTHYFNEWTSMMDRPEVLTVEEVADLFRASRRAIWQRIRNGDIRGFRLGRRVYVTRAEIERIMEGRSDA